MTSIERLRNWATDERAELRINFNGDNWVLKAGRDQSPIFSFQEVAPDIEKAAEALIAKLELIGEQVPK